jgi:hypothetical protein
MASIIAVMISMWVGIHANLLIAAALYAMLALPIRRLSATPSGRRALAPGVVRA